MGKGQAPNFVCVTSPHTHILQPHDVAVFGPFKKYDKQDQQGKAAFNERNQD
jgi:hypothetical protein